MSGCDSFEPHPLPDEPFSCEPENWADASRNPHRFIAHAGGSIDGRTYTNSRQALEQAYDQGFRLFEFDLIETADGRLVAMHDWDWWRDATGSTTRGEPTHREFKELPLFESYDTLDLSDLDQWFTTHPDTWLVTDKVNDFRALLEGFPHRDRMIVEVFGVEEFHRARQAGIRYPMLSLGAAIREDGPDRILSLLREEPVKFASVATKDIRRTREVLQRMRRNAACVYVFTSSDPAYLEERFDRVVYGAYSDTWNVRAGTCHSTACATY
jgi:hypothetical protein